MIKNPFYVDYAQNIKIDPTAFIHRNVYLSDNPRPDAPITIAEHAVIGPNVQILSVKQDVDWKRRAGFYGTDWTCRVDVGAHAYIGAGVIIM